MLRNYGNKLRDIVWNSNLLHVKLRKALGRNIRRRTAIVGAARHWGTPSHLTEHEQVAGFRADAMNSSHHVFGDHSRCKDYFCTGTKEEINIITNLMDSGILSKVEVQRYCILRNARSLLKDVDSNSVEQYKIVAKFVGGKRVNHSLKRSYGGKTHGAVVQFNTKTPLYKLHKTMCGRSPGNSQNFCR